MNDINVITPVLVDINLLEHNTGQIDGVPANPRQIDGVKFNALKRSIIEFPEMIGLRECIVYPKDNKYVVLCGNQRFDALKELEYSTVPCKILPLDVSVTAMRAYAALDNHSYGKWDIDAIVDSEEWLDTVQELELGEILGVSNEELDSLIAQQEQEEAAEAQAEDEQHTEPGGKSVDAFAAHSDFMRFGEYKCEMTEEEFCWLRDTFQNYRRINGVSAGFISYLRDK